MKLYFNPLACSLASRIALYETGLSAELIEVDSATKRTRDGQDYRAIYPLGLVPALQLADGTVVTENAAVLQYLADQAPETHLAPAAGFERVRLQQWLCFIGTELHKNFAPLLHKTAPAEVKAYAQERLEPKLAYVASHVERQPFLLDAYSIADAYLFAILNWAQATPVKLAPSLHAYHARLLERPAVRRAFGEERELYVAELARA